MTTIIGIKTNTDPEAVVIASDTHITSDGDDDKKKFKENSKIRIGKNFGIAYFGTSTTRIHNFFKYLLSKQSSRDPESFLRYFADIKKGQDISDYQGLIPPEILFNIKDIISGKSQANSDLEKVLKSFSDPSFKPSNDLEEFFFNYFRNLTSRSDPVTDAVRSGYFLEVNLLNRFIVRSEGEADSLDFILGTNTFNSVELYHVDAFGNLKVPSKTQDVEYIAGGSGESKVGVYMDEEEYKDDTRIRGGLTQTSLDIETAIAMCYGALKKASVDGSSGGFFDICVITKDKIEGFYDSIKTKFENAETEIYREISRKFKPQQVDEK